LVCHVLIWLPSPNTACFPWFSLGSYRYKQGFSDIAVNFSAELGGKRYTDTSPEAHRVHEAVDFGSLAAVKKTGLELAEDWVRSW
jgi:hypothetical protein